MKQKVLVAIVEMVRAILEVLTMTEMVGAMLMVAAVVEVKFDVDDESLQ